MHRIGLKCGLAMGLAVLLLLAAGCRRGTSDRATAAGSTSASETGGVEQWWSAFDFGDSTAANRDRAEQMMADWIFASAKTDSLTRVRAAKAFVHRAAASSRWRDYWQLTDHYLGNPNSPLRDDRLFVAVIREALEAFPLGELDSVKWADRMCCIDRNQVGSVATDFAFVRRDGKRDGAGTLADFVSAHVQKGQYLLLLFYDPDCDNCKLTLEHMRSDEQLAEWIEHGQLKVLAVYAEADLAMWRAHPEEVNATWYDAYSPDGEVQTHMRYYLPAAPSLYLLDHERRVVLKDATWNMVKGAVGEV